MIPCFVMPNGHAIESSRHIHISVVVFLMLILCICLIKWLTAW